MTRQRASIACLALLLMVLRQQQPHLAAARSSGDVATLPMHLAETGLFAPDGSGAIAAGNRPFAPQYPLWTDGATKRRWIHLPAGTTIDATNSRQWEFPVGTRLWKEFSFAGRPVETRVPVESVGRRLARGQLHLEQGRNRRGAGRIRRRRRRDGDRTGTAASHPVAQRLRDLPRRGTPPARLQSSATVDRPRSERDSRRAADAGHGDAADAVRRGSAHRSGSRTAARHRRASPTDDPQTRAVLGYLSGNCGGLPQRRRTNRRATPVLRLPRRRRWPRDRAADDRSALEMAGAGQTGRDAADRPRRLRSRAPSCCACPRAGRRLKCHRSAPCCRIARRSTLSGSGSAVRPGSDLGLTPV